MTATTTISSISSQSTLSTDKNIIQTNTNYVTKRFMEALYLFFCGSFDANKDTNGFYKQYMPLFFGIGNGTISENIPIPEIVNNSHKAQYIINAKQGLEKELTIGNRTSCSIMDAGYEYDTIEGYYSYIKIFAYISYSQLPSNKQITELGIFSSPTPNSNYNSMLLYRKLNEPDVLQPGQIKQYDFTIKFKH